MVEDQEGAAPRRLGPQAVKFATCTRMGACAVQGGGEVHRGLRLRRHAGLVNCEGVRFVPKGKPSKTLAVFMHPASTLQLLPMPQALARAGVHVLCAGSRFAKNDTPLIMEKVLLDLGAYIRRAKEEWGYEKVVLCGWSGGGSLSLFYQSQAEKPSSRRRRRATRWTWKG